MQVKKYFADMSRLTDLKLFDLTSLKQISIVPEISAYAERQSTGSNEFENKLKCLSLPGLLFALLLLVLI